MAIWAFHQFHIGWNDVILMIQTFASYPVFLKIFVITCRILWSSANKGLSNYAKKTVCFFTCGSICNTNACGAKQIHETNNLNQT